MVYTTTAVGYDNSRTVFFKFDLTNQKTEDSDDNEAYISISRRSLVGRVAENNHEETVGDHEIYSELFGRRPGYLKELFSKIENGSTQIVAYEIPEGLEKITASFTLNGDLLDDFTFKVQDIAGKIILYNERGYERTMGIAEPHPLNIFNIDPIR